jgi:SET domain-containing protein
MSEIFRLETAAVMEVRNTAAKGRGVFALAKFARGELIEAAPVIVIPGEQWRHVEPTVLSLYIYNFGPTPEQEHAAIALGYGSLYNHSYRPNAQYIKDWDAQLIRFVALRAIEEGEEITVNYNGSPENQTPIWFEVHE